MTIVGKGNSARVCVVAVAIGNAQHHLVSDGIIAVATIIPIIMAFAIGDAFDAAAGALAFLWGSCLSALWVPSPVLPTLFRTAGADTSGIAAVACLAWAIGPLPVLCWNLQSSPLLQIPFAKNLHGGGGLQGHSAPLVHPLSMLHLLNAFCGL